MKVLCARTSSIQTGKSKRCKDIAIKAGDCFELSEADDFMRREVAKRWPNQSGITWDFYTVHNPELAASMQTIAKPLKLNRRKLAPADREEFERICQANEAIVQEQRGVYV